MNIKKKKYTFVIVVILLTTITFMTYSILYKKHLKNEFKDIAISYYEEELINYMPLSLKTLGELKITLSDLSDLNIDLSSFNKMKINYDQSYVLLTYDEDNKYVAKCILKYN